VPQRVIGEVVALPPIAFEALGPYDAVARPPGHLEEVLHRMRRPDIGPVALDRLAASALGLIIGTSFLEAKGMATEDEAVIRDAGFPGGERACHDPMHPFALPGVEVAVLRQFDCQHIVRPLAEDRLPTCRRAGQIAGGPGCKRRQMSRLALCDPCRRGFSRLIKRSRGTMARWPKSIIK